MKSSSYIKQIAKTNIIKKGQRTWLSIISVLLSTAIIFTSLTLFLDVFSFSKNADYTELGNYHYAALVKEAVESSSRYNMTLDINTGEYGYSLNENYYNWRILDVNEESPILPFTIKEGTLPSKTGEVLVSENWNKSVGDTIKLNRSQILVDNKMDTLYQLPIIDTTIPVEITNHEYTVVGVYKANDSYLKNTGNIDIVYSTFPKELSNNVVYYVQDNQVHLTGAFDSFLTRFNVTEANVFTNMEVISNDSVKNYLQDTTVILVMFVIIAAIGISVSLISVHNVLIISDKDRKKELGLLKSIGATPNEVKKLITIELMTLGVIGAILGLGLGSAVSYFVLNLFIEKLYITFKLSMILNPIIIVVSLLSGIALMYISGMKAYDKYIYSTAISDLKEFSYDYSEPMKPTNKRHRTFSWRMFVIYNGRMKSQTKNVFHSFTLFLFTCVLFMSTFLSNTIYVNRYVKQGYDFDVSNYADGTFISTPNPNVAYDIYEKESEGKINVESIYAERIMISAENFFWTLEESYADDLLLSYQTTARIEYKTEKDDNGDLYCNLYHFPVALDNKQIEELKPYVVEGSLENIGVNDVVSIQSSDARLGSQLCSGLNVGEEVGWDTIDNKKTIVAVVQLPDEAFDSLHFNYTDYPRVLAYSMEALVDNGKGLEMSEHIYIKLKNATAASSTLDTLDEVLNKTETFETYDVDPVALTVETNRFATFIIEVLLYPLFLMLFIVSLMNLNNVFIGNVHLKRGDISVMKSVGMTNSQLSMLFIFEYIEGYLNAALLSIAVFIPIVFLEGLIGLPSVYQFGSNIIGTLLIGLCFLGILLVSPLIYLSLRRIKAILPIENLKNVD